MTTSTQLTLDLKAPPHFDFNHFVPGNNHEALSALSLEAPERFITLWGAQDVGKSHLLKAWVQQAIVQEKSALYVDAQHNTLTDAARHALFLAIDHIDFLDDASQTTLFSIYNFFRESEKVKLLVACTVPPNRLPLREDLTSRISSGLTFEIHPLSDEHKLAALQIYVNSRQINIREDVLHYLLRYFQRDLSSLTMLLDRLDQEALINHHPITIPFLKSILPPLNSGQLIATESHYLTLWI